MVIGLDALRQIVPTPGQDQSEPEHEVVPQSMHHGAGESGADATQAQGDLTLLFRAGERPKADDIAAAIAASQAAGLPASVSYRPDAAAGWLARRCGL